MNYIEQKLQNPVLEAVIQRGLCQLCQIKPIGLGSLCRDCWQGMEVLENDED